MILGFAALGCGRSVDGVDVQRSLVDLFPYAEVQVETSAIDLGSPEGRNHLVYGWGHDQVTSGQGSFVWAMGDRSELEIFSGNPRDVNLQLVGRGLPSKDLPLQEVRVLVNGNEVGTIEISRSSRNRYAVSAPARVWRNGPNRLALHYAYNKRLIDISPQRKDLRPLAMAWNEIILDGFENAARPSVGVRDGSPLLELPHNTQIDYFLDVPPGSALIVEDVILLDGGDGNCDGKLQIEMVWDDDDHPFLQETVLTDAFSPPLVIPLGVGRETHGRLSLRAVPNACGGGGGVGLVDPKLRVLEIQNLPVEETQKKTRFERPNIIIYLIDALRADHLGCYGYHFPVSPRIDEFAADSIVFDRAYAQCSWTRPAVASLFTGVYPQVHGTNSIEDSIPPDLANIAELLKRAGYETGAVSTNSIAGPKWGFSRGMDRFEMLKEKLKTTEIHQQSDALNKVVFKWIREESLREPFFLFLHTTDPHGPYTPRDPYRTRFANEVRDPGIGQWDRLQALKKLREDQVDESLIKDLTALYDAEIAFNDANFGMLIDRLKAKGLYDSSMIILLSDHGEEFFDHGRWMHGWSLYQEQLHVPMIVKMPGGRNAGYRVGGIMEQVDVLPTILEYVGIPAPNHIQGNSALTEMLHRRARKSSQEAFAYLARSDPRHLRAYFLGDTKLIMNQAMDLPRAAVEVFNLATDAEEKLNLSESRPVLAGFLLASFQQSTSSWAHRQLSSAELSTRQRERLKALGYID